MIARSRPADRGDHDAVAGQDPDANGAEPGDEDEKDGVHKSRPTSHAQMDVRTGRFARAGHARDQTGRGRTAGQRRVVEPRRTIQRGRANVDLVVDPTHPDTVYTAAPAVASGRAPTPAWSLAVGVANERDADAGALAVGPDGALWAGTGEANPSGGGLTYFGNGIYKIDRWQRHVAALGLVDSAATSRIVVDPDQPEATTSRRRARSPSPCRGAASPGRRRRDQDWNSS